MGALAIVDVLAKAEIILFYINTEYCPVMMFFVRFSFFDEPLLLVIFTQIKEITVFRSYQR